MKFRLRHIIIWLTLLNGTTLNASHILGGEIYYKHLKNNQYKVTLNIFRDCNGCKINGNGGGSTSENCSEIDYIYVKSNEDSSSKEVKFSLKREFVSDITPICNSKISACNKNSNTIFGIELQSFTATIDLDNDAIKGFCNYIVYIVIAERNSDITTGQAKQNFCIDAMINACLDKANSSSEFINKPMFIYNSNKPVYQSFGVIDNDGDSIVYSLTPALTGYNKTAKYNAGYSFNKPLSIYCADIACIPDKNASLPTGFYFGNNNGESVFTPVLESERAVISVKVEEYKQVYGKWVKAGYIKRDIQIYVKNSEGNNTPVFTSNDYFEVCENSDLEIKITAKDDKNIITSTYDSLSYYSKDKPENSEFTQYYQSDPPYRYSVLKWHAPKYSSSKKSFNFTVNAVDNNCPLNYTSVQIISIKINPKNNLKIQKTDLGCNNFEIKAINIENSSTFEMRVVDILSNIEILKTSKFNDTISNLENGKYLITAQITNYNGCTTFISDTLFNKHKSFSYIKGDSIVCKNTEHSYIVINNIHPEAKTEWFFDDILVGSDNLNAKFLSNGILKSVSIFNKGKWSCTNTLSKQINVLETPEITAADKFEICHNSGFYNLSKIDIIPTNGTWSCESKLFINNFINTNDSLPYNDKELQLKYTVKNHIGCTATKSIDFKIKAIPEFELNSITNCEKSTAIWLNNLIKKPYNKLDFNYNWKIYGYNGIIKEINGSKYVLSSDLGLGIHKISGKITAKNSCSNIDSAIIEITPSVNIKFENEIVACQNSGFADINKISGVTPSSGNWSFFDFPLFVEKNKIKTDTCGTFEAIYIYDNYGCYDSKKVNIKIVCSPEINTNIINENICENKLPIALEATPKGGIWEGNYINSENIFNPPTSEKNTNYLLKYKVISEKCSFEKKTNIKVLVSPKNILFTNKTTYCQGESILLNGNIKNTDILKANYYSENIELNIDGKQNVENLYVTNSKYQYPEPTNGQIIKIIAENKNLCSDTSLLYFKVLEKPEILKLNDTAFCENTNSELIPLINYKGNIKSYFWEKDNATISESKVLKSVLLAKGVNKLKFTVNSDFCGDEKTITVIVNKKPYVDFIIIPSETVSILNSKIECLNQSEKNLEFLWNFGTSRIDNTSTELNPKYKYTDTGFFIIKLYGTNQYGCSDLYIKELKIIPELVLFVPNAFSPDNKGIEENNSFGVVLNHYQQFKINIFDRWGHKVYYSENPKERWNGMSGDVYCTPDIYIYNIEILSVSGHTYKYRGTITLIK